MVLDTRRRKGFTLIELLVVMAIILILAGLLTPGLFKAKQQAGKVSCANNMKQIGTALQLYASKYNESYPASLSTLTSDNELDDPNVLNCPVTATSYTAYTAPSAGTASNVEVLHCASTAHGPGSWISLYMGGYAKIK